MAAADGDRSSYFPTIEKKYGKPIAFWLHEVRDLGDVRYQDQVACLRERHGFSQAHANAVVMYVRGSKRAKRFSTVDEYFATLAPEQAETARAIFAAIQFEYPQLELVVAWNQPMLRGGRKYVFGLSAAPNHLLLAPWSTAVLDALAPELEGYVVNKKTVRVPSDWKVESELLIRMVGARLSEIEAQ